MLATPPVLRNYLEGINLDLETHGIQEGSAFFQGHPDQFFTRYSISFRVTYLNEDFGSGSNFNYERFRRFFSETIKRLLVIRSTNEGYDYPHVGQKDIRIAYPRFLDSMDDAGFSGRFKVYPNAAICSKCHVYFKLNEKKPCSCDARIEHFTFVAFCDECGATYPIEAMSNLQGKCKKCGEPKGLKKITWDKRDVLISYKVNCVKCGDSTQLVLYRCDHKDRPSLRVRSTKDPSSFRGVPARAGVIHHPLVKTIPDIPLPDEIDINGLRNASSIELTAAFDEFFGDMGKVNETYLHLPELREKILAKDVFWESPRITVICEDFELDIEDRESLPDYEIYRILKTTLLNAKNSLSIKPDGSSNKDTIFKRYFLQEVKDALETLKNIELDVEDLQALFLLSEDSTEQVSRGEFGTKKRSIPRSPPADWNDLLNDFGLQLITHVENLNMVQALLGIIDGSTKRKPLLFRVIESGPKGKKKPTVYVRNFKTEGIIFKFSIEKIVAWLKDNKIISHTDIDSSTNLDSAFRQVLCVNEDASDSVKTLLHTFAHLLIQQSSIDTGLDIRSLSENIYPKSGAILIYSTNEVNIGGLEYTFDFHMADWLSRVKDLAEDCPQDPGCIEDEHGACNACSYLPEFVCRYFNQQLDRASFIGGPRYDKGFFK